MVAFVTGGLLAGIPLDNVPWPLQLLAFAGAGLATYWAVPTIWAAIVALDAPRRQRNEARTALRTAQAMLESRVRELEERRAELERTAARRKELRRRLFDLLRQSEYMPQSMARGGGDLAWEIAESWVNQVAEQLEEHGASDRAEAFRFSEADRQREPGTVLAERRGELHSLLDHVDDPLWSD